MLERNRAWIGFAGLLLVALFMSVTARYASAPHPRSVGALAIAK